MKTDFRAARTATDSKTVTREADIRIGTTTAFKTVKAGTTETEEIFEIIEIIGIIETPVIIEIPEITEQVVKISPEPAANTRPKRLINLRPRDRDASRIKERFSRNRGKRKIK